MFLFGKKPKSHLGVDIGASAVKLAEVEKEGGRHKLINYGIFPLREYLEKREKKVSAESPRIPQDEMAEIIKKTMREARIKTREAYLSIPVYSSFLTLIELPPMPEKEIAAALPFEAKKYVPVPISEVVLDWSIVTLGNKQTNLQILLIAVPKEVIDYYNKIVKLTGLNLRSVEEETFSLTRCLVGNDKSAIILIDAGARSINISIVDGGYIRIAHNLEMGGTKIIKAVSQQMGLSLEKAEELKENLLAIGQSLEEQNPELKGVVYSILGNVAIEVREIIDSYQSKHNRRIEKCILVGGAIRAFGFVDYFMNKLNMEVSLGNPFARVIYPQLLEPALKDLGPSLAVAVGLAMSE